ncbi:hypothetical protein N2152v2_002705 [Parachlorella kessleri]
MHLALNDLSVACQLAAEPLGSMAGLPTRRPKQQAGQAQPSEGQLQPGTKYGAEYAVLLLSRLLPLVEAAADMGRLNLQQLLRHGPGFNKRSQWAVAAAAFAKVLHKAADAAAAGHGLGEDGRWGALDEEFVSGAGYGLHKAIGLLGDMYPNSSGSPGLNELMGLHAGGHLTNLGDRPAISSYLALVQLAELLVRLVPKRSALTAIRYGSEAVDVRLSEARALLLNYAEWVTDELLAVPSINMSRQQQASMAPQPAIHSLSSPSSPSSSSRNNATLPAAVPLQSIASLAVTAAKVYRCLPDLATLDPSNACHGVLGSSFHYSSLLEKVAMLCCQVLAVNPHLAQAPGPQRSLTRHLQTTGFLAFLCLPALAQAHGAMDEGDRATLIGLRRTDLLVGGLIGKAASLLRALTQALAAEHSEGLAVALVTSGLLQAAAEHSLRLARGRIRRAPACEAVASGSEAQQQNGIVHDVAVSAWTCCNPGCTNMAGQQEASLALRKCAGCGEARYCSSPQLGIPAGLAAAVETLSTELVLQGFLKAILAAPTSTYLAADLQGTYCHGSLITRYCSQGAATQTPEAVAGFLVGLIDVARAFPGTAVDYEALKTLAVHVNSAVDAASQLHDTEGGTANFAQQFLQQTFVGAAATCMSAPSAVERWGLGPASPALEPMLHLALGDLSAACQLAAEPLGSTAGLPARRSKQQQAGQTQVSEGTQYRADSAVLLLSNLLPLVNEAAEQGHLNLQHLLRHTPGFIKVYMEDTEEAADAAAAGHGHGEGGTWSALEEALVSGAGEGFQSAGGLLGDMYPDSSTGSPGLIKLAGGSSAFLGDQPAFSSYLALVRLAEVLVRLVPKHSVLTGLSYSTEVSSSSKAVDGQLSEARTLLLNYGAWVADELQAAPLMSLHQAPMVPQPASDSLSSPSHSSSSSSRSSSFITPPAEILLQSVASLAATAAKSTGFLTFLCLPALAQALGAMDSVDRATLIKDRGTDLLVEGLIGKNSRHFRKAASLLLVLGQALAGGHTEGLAVALVTSDLLHAAAQQSLLLTRDGIRRASGMKAWEEVCDQLLPALSAACKTVASGSEAQQQNGIFHDVAVSAWTCCNPSCTNMAGQQEASLALSKQCQRQDWRRHKPVCQAIKELK